MLLSSTFLRCFLLCYTTQMVLTFQSVNEIIIVTIQMNAIEQYFAVLLLVMYVVKGGSNF